MYDNDYEIVSFGGNYGNILFGEKAMDKTIKQHKDDKSLRRRLDFKRYRRGINRARLGVSNNMLKDLNKEKRLFANYHRISAPRQFTLIENTDEVLGFIQRLMEAFSKRKKVYVSLRQLKFISGDAIVLLLSNVIEFKAAGIDFNGNRPKIGKIAKKLEDSGFFKILYDENDSVKAQFQGHHTISIDDEKDIYTHATKSVDSELTASLIENAAEFLWGTKRRCQGVQRILIELMQNTNNHASRKTGEKYWWLSVSKAYNPKRVCFSFIDYGMGIFNSLATKGTNDKFYGWLNKMKQICTPEHHYEVLHKMMTGEFHNTVTGKSYRGKGIPGIYKQIERGAITKLITISNDAFANATEDDFHHLIYPLSGTFVYWEVDVNCKNLPLYEESV